MAGSPVVNLADARAELKAWTEALSAVRLGQAYSIGGRSVTRQDVGIIRQEIQRWHATVLSLEALARNQDRPMGATASFPAPGGRGGIMPQSEWESS